MKQFNLDEFLAPYREMLEKSGLIRLRYYEYVIDKLVKLNRPITVVETGTMWAPISENMGAFTYVFADLIKNHTGGKLITIDISEKSIQNCKESTKEFADVIEYVTSDSVEYLESLSDADVEKFDFVYFDSFDFSVPDPVPSQLHHYRELSAIYKRLRNDVILAVDDNFLPNTEIEWITYTGEAEPHRQLYRSSQYRILGKGTLIDHFLTTNGWNRRNDWLHYGHEYSYLFGYERA
jgi:predicted O-methyltransferase YrrM